MGEMGELSSLDPVMARRITSHCPLFLCAARASMSGTRMVAAIST